MPISYNDEPLRCSLVHAGWCHRRIALLTLVSHSLLCNCSWSTWTTCMKVGGKKYILGTIHYPYLLYVLALQLLVHRVYCYKILEIRLQRTLKNHLVFHLVPKRSLYLCYPWHLSDIDVFFKIFSDEDCFSRQTAVCPFLCVSFFVCVMYLLFLPQNLTGFNEMRKRISLRSIHEVTLFGH